MPKGQRETIQLSLSALPNLSKGDNSLNQLICINITKSWDNYRNKTLIKFGIIYWGWGTILLTIKWLK